MTADTIERIGELERELEELDAAALDQLRAGLEWDCDYFSELNNVYADWCESSGGEGFRLALGEAVADHQDQGSASVCEPHAQSGPRSRPSDLAERTATPSDALL